MSSKLSNEIYAFKTIDFGPKYWYVLFTMILGSYPNKIESSNKQHKVIKKYFKYTFKGLMYTLPCSICRNSYKKFYKVNNINNYLDSKIKLAKWLYLLKDMVNKKLINQEKELLKQGKISNCKTSPSPPFNEVIKMYYLQRAGVCSKEYKKCM